METMKNWEELQRLLPLVRAGWTVSPHEHMEQGCRCLSCNETTGWEMSNHLHSTFCDEQETERPLYDQCLQELFTYEEAKAIELLLENKDTLLRLIDWYIKEEARITYGNLNG